MSTLADIRKAADGAVHTWIDDTTPPRHFGVTAVILGLYTNYLLAGVEGDPAAAIVGRIEYDGAQVYAYRGAGLKGGCLLPGATDSESAFRAMLQDHH